MLLANYSYWPFVNFLNFKFVPVHFRMAVINLSSIVWNAYLAFKNQTSKKKFSELAVDKATEAAYNFPPK